MNFLRYISWIYFFKVNVYDTNDYILQSLCGHNTQEELLFLFLKVSLSSTPTLSLTITLDYTLINLLHYLKVQEMVTSYLWISIKKTRCWNQSCYLFFYIKRKETPQWQGPEENWEQVGEHTSPQTLTNNILKDQVPSDDKSHKLANADICVDVRWPSLWHPGPELSITQPCPGHTQLVATLHTLQKCCTCSYPPHTRTQWYSGACMSV